MSRNVTKKNLVITSLLEGSSVVSASRSAGVTSRTVFRWLKDPVFREQLNTLQLYEMETISRRLVNLASTAVDTLETVLKEPTRKGSSISVRVSLGVLDIIGKWKEQVDFEDRLTELERKVLINGKK